MFEKHIKGCEWYGETLIPHLRTNVIHHRYCHLSKWFLPMKYCQKWRKSYNIFEERNIAWGICSMDLFNYKVGSFLKWHVYISDMLYYFHVTFKNIIKYYLFIISWRLCFKICISYYIYIDKFKYILYVTIKKILYG